MPTSPGREEDAGGVDHGGPGACNCPELGTGQGPERRRAGQRRISPCRRPLASDCRPSLDRERLERRVARNREPGDRRRRPGDRPARHPRESVGEPGGRPRQPHVRRGRSCGKWPRPRGRGYAPSSRIRCRSRTVNCRRSAEVHRLHGAPASWPFPPRSVASSFVVAQFRDDLERIVLAEGRLLELKTRPRQLLLEERGLLQDHCRR